MKTFEKVLYNADAVIDGTWPVSLDLVLRVPDDLIDIQIVVPVKTDSVCLLQTQ